MSEDNFTQMAIVAELRETLTVYNEAKNKLFSLKEELSQLIGNLQNEFEVLNDTLNEDTAVKPQSTDNENDSPQQPKDSKTSKKIIEETPSDSFEDYEEEEVSQDELPVEDSITVDEPQEMEEENTAPEPLIEERPKASSRRKTAPKAKASVKPKEIVDDADSLLDDEDLFFEDEEPQESTDDIDNVSF